MLSAKFCSPDSYTTAWASSAASVLVRLAVKVTGV
jgi:hypothetical protein